MSPFSDATARTNFAADLSTDFSFPQANRPFGFGEGEDDDDGFGDFQAATIEIAAGDSDALEMADGETTPTAKRTWTFEDSFDVPMETPKDPESQATLIERLREAQLTDSSQWPATHSSSNDNP